MKDPHYKPALQNPFAPLPRLREGKKIIGSSGDLFSSCFELPSPARVSTPTTFFEDLSTPTKSASLYDLKVCIVDLNWIWSTLFRYNYDLIYYSVDLNRNWYTL